MSFVFFLYYVWWLGGIERLAYSSEFIQVYIILYFGQFYDSFTAILIKSSVIENLYMLIEIILLAELSLQKYPLSLLTNMC